MVGAYIAFYCCMFLLGKFGVFAGLPGWMVLAVAVP